MYIIIVPDKLPGPQPALVFFFVVVVVVVVENVGRCVIPETEKNIDMDK